MSIFGKYFYGHEISKYGQENGRVDYRTFAKAFDAVLANNIMSRTADIGYWEQVSGFIDNSEQIDEIREQIEELENQRDDLDDTESETAEEIEDKIRDLEEQIEELEQEEADPDEIYQWYIISDPGAEICKEFGEIVFYNEELDLYLWGVTHWGTAWDYVLTGIECEKTA